MYCYSIGGKLEPNVIHLKYPFVLRYRDSLSFKFKFTG